MMYEIEGLLSRDIFRARVFERDGHQCIFCGEREGLDAHHILERRLWPDGGYYVENGATVCQEHHLACERTEISCEEVRAAAKIRNVLLPPHLYEDTRYDKWGNPYLPNSNVRMPGELYEDESVRKILAGQDFQREVKYPRTYHLPWSPGKTKDDRTLSSLDVLSGEEIVVTEKLDGECTSLYQHTLHARSFEYASRVDRDRIKALHAGFCSDIPETFRICGENLWGRHSIAYEDLPTFFFAFSVWNGLTCLSWDESLEWFSLLGLQHVPVLYEGPYDEMHLRDFALRLNFDKQEGYVVRPRRAFKLREFPYCVGKYVRAEHVRTQAHWTRRIVPNGFRP